MSDLQRFEYEVSRQEYFGKMKVADDKVQGLIRYLKNQRQPKKRYFIRGQEIK